jgi:hypothetical protein
MKHLFSALVAIFMLATAQVALAQAPAIVFSEDTHNFGEAAQGEFVKHTFKFKNTGDADLVLSNVKASCGCTVPEWPREAIKPGGSGEIQVTFSTAGKSGFQKKAVTIMANTEPQTKIIYIEGNVTTPAANDPGAGQGHGHDHNHDHGHEGHTH